jgi:hypothetical protein
MKRVTLKVLNERVGGMSKPSKMPGTSYSISAFRCNVGSKLAKIPGSVCHGCYARKGRYRFGNTQNALERRFQRMQDNPNWVADMAEIISRQSKGFHRWHDSGDVQGWDHLMMILDVARATPDVKHWLPTKEYGLIRRLNRWKANGGNVPSNIVIRVSAPMRNQELSGFGHTSSVYDEGKPDGSVMCEAYTRKGKCGPCRDCWDEDISDITYPKH